MGKQWEKYLKKLPPKQRKKLLDVLVNIRQGEWS